MTDNTHTRDKGTKNYSSNKEISFEKVPDEAFQDIMQMLIQLKMVNINVMLVLRVQGYRKAVTFTV